MREGYKKTELGCIPHEWSVLKISECTNDIFLGLTSKVDYVESNGVPLIRTTDISKGILNFQNVKYISLKQHEYLTKYRKASKGDVLVSKSGTLGTCCIVDTDKEFSIYESIIAIKTKESIIISKYLVQLLKDDKTLNRMLNKKVGGAVGHLNIKNFRELLVVIPNLKEQKKLADILSIVDEQIENADKLIEKTKELKKGLMQRLLTKGIGHYKFKETEIGRIPEEWEVKTIGEVAKFQGGYAFKSSDYVDNGIKLIKITNVQQNNLVWDDISCLPKEFIEKYPEYKSNYNDVVMAMTRPIISTGIKVCRIKYKDIPSVLNQRVGRFVVSDELDGEYLYQYALSNYFINKVNELSSTTGQPNISSKQIESILIPAPEIREQKRIALIISSVDEQIEQYESKKEKLQELKKGLMQKLLTGKIRVKV